MIHRHSEYTVPLPRDLLLRLGFVFVIIGNDIVQELKEIFQTLKFPVFVFVEVLKLIFVLLRKCGVEPREGIIGGSITKWTTLDQTEINLLSTANMRGTYGAEIMHKQLDGFQLVLVDFLRKIQFAKKLAEDFPIILCTTISNHSS